MSKKQQLVLHICCAPDQAWVIKSLKEEYDIYCYFCNPNIDSKKEYIKRYKETEMVAKYFNVPLAEYPYNPKIWEKWISGYEDTPEFGTRCEQCFLLRFEKTAEFCREIKWPRFTTVMSISPYKRIEMLNDTGKTIANKFNIKYEEFNFKKKNGYYNSVQLSKELNLYRQDYCGCRLSKKEREQRIIKKTNKINM